MGKKRRNIQKGDDDQFNLDKFDDHSAIKNDHLVSTNNSNNNNSGGGMSRAAKKRAKKRAKNSSAVTTTTAGGSNNELARSSDAEHKSILKQPSDSQKMQLPLDSDDDDDVTDAIQLKEPQVVIKPDKIKKKKKKKEKSNETQLISAKHDEAKMDDNNMDEIDDDNDDDDDLNIMNDDDHDIEPELEELLSTLTPMQILLLDGKDATTTAAAESNESNDDEKEEAVMPEAEGDINPKNVIGDITTELRARILLSSLLSPSGVTVNEFYQQYWGKRPLLAALDDINENDDDDDDDDDEPSMKMSAEAATESANHITRLDGFLNRTIIDEMIRKNKLRYGLDLNVTRYTDSMGNGLRHRITLDPPPKKKKKRSKNNSISVGNDNHDEEEEELEYIVANPNDVWSNVDTSQCTVRLLRPHEHNDNIHSLLSVLESEFGCMVGSNAYLTPLNSQGFAPHYDDVDVFILQLE
eukprot:scaffold23_cov101-Skeletonema_dohrnii-CCMP3373.AAC.11